MLFRWSQLEEQFLLQQWDGFWDEISFEQTGDDYRLVLMAQKTSADWLIFWINLFILIHAKLLNSRIRNIFFERLQYMKMIGENNHVDVNCSCSLKNMLRYMIFKFIRSNVRWFSFWLWNWWNLRFQNLYTHDILINVISWKFCLLSGAAQWLYSIFTHFFIRHDRIAIQLQFQLRWTFSRLSISAPISTFSEELRTPVKWKFEIKMPKFPCRKKVTIVIHSNQFLEFLPIFLIRYL